jgi:hypothetical protein
LNLTRLGKDLAAALELQQNKLNSCRGLTNQ